MAHKDILSIYKKLGFSIIPVERSSKIPRIPWKEFCSRQPTDDELASWFGGKMPDDGGPNVGIVTGQISGLVALDVDGPTGEESLQLLGPLPETVSVRTGKGRHLYFRHPGGEIPNFAGKLPGIDLRGDGGFVVAPPSIHQNGNRYEWENHPGSVAMADLPASVLKLAVRDREVSAPVAINARDKANSAPRMARSARQEIDRLIGELAQADEGQRNDTLNRVAFQLAQHCAAGHIAEEWARQELLIQGKRIGLPADECQGTINSAFEAGLKQPIQSAEPVLSILDAAPETMDRPIRMIDGKAYGATWVPVGVGNTHQAKPDFELVVFDGDGAIYSEREIAGSLPMEELRFAVDLPHKPRPDKVLSPVGLRRWISRDLPEPQAVFDQVKKGVDAFVSFEHSLSDQNGMCELVACWIIGGYALDAFDVVGYPWPTGERGSGKTQLLNTVSSLAYLGRTITSGSSFAAIRDEAQYGATIAFDDCENVRNMENEKRELLLAGNMRGTEISYKVPVGDEWQTRYINNFAPRLFSSIGLPDPVLASRTISIPLIASIDKGKTRRNPASTEDWPIDLRTTVDNLWLTAVSHLAEIMQCDQEASEVSDLHARGHDIWRMPLAIAYWLQHRHGVAGVFDRITAISVAYQKQKQDAQGLDAISVLLMALDHMLVDEGKVAITIETGTIVQRVLQMADAMEQVEPDVLTLDANRLGKLIGRLGFTKGKSHSQKRAWVIDRKTIEKAAKGRSIELLSAEEREILPSVPPMDFDLPAEESMASALAD